MIEGIFLLLGSNLGDKKKLLNVACMEIDKQIGQITRKSALYETAAWGKTDQPTFINQVVEVSSDLPAKEILVRINQIESLLGRVRMEKWGARMIDIDILYYGQDIVDTESLTIPHPGIPNRQFTLVPLVEIAPDFMHPVIQKSNKELLATCPDTLEVNLIKR
ncbi:2-amino-4-hydroxy-6-hydroxymethyldihydropteridine diphosphokinase [Fulvivirga sp. 29W222]|uniref:2-amino-4-hydroxy-6-hydroxymethyldihydropteridine pyrophosphokinase n=1 Tax=Fulvivirga marina TaxID=2494733 RepID=A0A937FVT0_9BACT|nr:2-amino-4-hydroxy-6-hydroxymethyldihydropteridine diphosphokinase [Fulvivirga marina]MBL6445275.1 2-amino-4-hydroxy-6-hydroxymethyldihydropteridine diphosphokinase [Fulvivirga marina]